jgi:hypothetical protein
MQCPISGPPILLFAMLACLACTGTLARADEPAKKKVVFLAGGPSHRFGAHDHLAGCTLLANRLKEVPGFDAVVSQGWPADETIFDGAAAVVMYCDGGPGHLGLAHIAALDKLSSKGVGIGCIHYAVEVPEDHGNEWWLKWMGGYFQTNYSVNPHWVAEFKEFPKHPVSRGVRPFSTNDEWYYNMRFREGMENVVPILSAIPPDSTREGKDGPHSGNPEVRKGIGKNQKEHVLWVSENAPPDGSRGFGTSGGHVHWNWAQDEWRKVVLNSIVWIAKGEVPENGVESKRPTIDEMLQNHDEPIPADFDKEATAKRMEEMNKPQGTSTP